MASTRHSPDTASLEWSFAAAVMKPLHSRRQWKQTQAKEVRLCLWKNMTTRSFAAAYFQLVCVGARAGVWVCACACLVHQHFLHGHQ